MIDSWETLAWLCAAAYMVGVSKTGFGGIGVLPVAIMAHLYGKASVGALLPMLVVADLSVYPIFRKYGSWTPVWKLLPPAVVGMVVGYFLLKEIPEEWARPMIGSIILVMVLLQLLRRWKERFFAGFAESRGFGQAAGVSAGVATMVANAAGPIFQLYFLSRKMPKLEMIGDWGAFFSADQYREAAIYGKTGLHQSRLVKDESDDGAAYFARCFYR